MFLYCNAAFCKKYARLFLIILPDRLQQRVEARHVAADMRVEIGQPDALQADSLLLHLGLELAVLAGLEDRVIQGLQHRSGRFR